MTTTEYELPPSFQEQTGPMLSRLRVDLSVPEAPAPSSALIDDVKHADLQRRALQILFLPNFCVSDHIFREGLDPSYTKEGFPTVRSAEILGGNFRLELINNFNHRVVSAYMSLNGISRAVVAYWSGMGYNDEPRLDVSTARWFQSDVLERVLSEVMSIPRTSE